MAPQTVKREWVNIFLALLVIALGLVVWFSPEQGSEQRPPDTLTSLTPEEIQSIRIANASGAAFTLRRVADSWQMTEPYQLPANDARIDRLLRILSTPVYERFPRDPVQLGEFGLSPPAAVISVDGLELSLGDTHPINHRRYVGMGSTINLINDIFAHHLLARAEDFLSTRLLPEEATVTGIDTPQWRLIHQPGQKRPWHLEPAADGVSMDRLVQKVDDWSHAMAVRVQPGPAQAPPDAQPVVVHTLKGAVRFLALPDEPSTLLREGEGISYQLPALRDLLTSPAGDEP